MFQDNVKELPELIPVSTREGKMIHRASIDAVIRGLRKRGLVKGKHKAIRRQIIESKELRKICPKLDFQDEGRFDLYVVLCVVLNPCNLTATASAP
jgi:hypothetical protein